MRKDRVFFFIIGLSGSGKTLWASELKDLHSSWKVIRPDLDFNRVENYGEAISNEIRKATDYGVIVLEAEAMSPEWRKTVLKTVPERYWRIAILLDFSATELNQFARYSTIAEWQEKILEKWRWPYRFSGEGWDYILHCPPYCLNRNWRILALIAEELCK
jgi:ABC-type dipeptide/oligopeptide/nickel transport system ATPase component